MGKNNNLYAEIAVKSWFSAYRVNEKIIFYMLEVFKRGYFEHLK